MSVKQHFVIGEEWIYYKIYCGERIAQELLVQELGPLCKELTAQKVITHWFFIRYKDPDFHLRVRLHLCDTQKSTVVIEKMQQTVQPYLTDFQVWKLQTDMYQREINRYGMYTIKMAEELFWLDSIFVCETMHPKIDDTDYAFLIIARINFWLIAFKLSDSEKLLFCDRNLKLFKNEFAIDKTTNKKLSQEYKRLKRQLLSVISGPVKESNSKVSDQKATQKASEVLLILKENEDGISKTDFLQSLIHMLVNRAFTNHQRYHEFVLYYFLTRYYQSKAQLRAK